MNVQLRRAHEQYHNPVCGPRTSVAALTGRGFVLAFGAALAASSLALGARNEIAAAVPAARPIFARLGLAATSSGLMLEKIRSRIRLAPTRTLMIAGEIADHEGRAVHVPRLRLSVRAQDGREIYHWIAAPPKKVLMAGESIEFTASLADPPPSARKVVVSFRR